MSENKFYILAPDMFSWRNILDFLSLNTSETTHRIIGKKVRQAFLVDGKKYLCEISYLESSRKIEVTFLYGISDKKVKDTIHSFVVDWFDLRADLKSFYKWAQKDNILQKLVRKFNNLRIVGTPDFYEAITWGIIAQQITMTVAHNIKQRLVEKYGDFIELEDEKYWLYPDAKVISQASVEELHEIGLSKRKSEYLIGVSQKVASGEISKQYYDKFTSAETVEKEMCKLRGVGPWTANYVLMRCLLRGDAFPKTDVGLLNGVKTLEGLDNKPSPEHMDMLQHKWGKWCNYATFYIWYNSQYEAAKQISK